MAIRALWLALDAHVTHSSPEAERLRKSHDYHYYIDKWLERYRVESEGALWVAAMDKELCGFIAVQTQTIPWHQRSRSALIGPCFVDAPYRRMGIATRLLHTVEQWALKHNLYDIDVLWEQGNTEANHFWTKHGFRSAQVRASKRLRKTGSS